MYKHTSRIYTYVLYKHIYIYFLLYMYYIHYKFGSLDVNLPIGINQNLRSTSSFHIASLKKFIYCNNFLRMFKILSEKNHNNIVMSYSKL